MTEEELIIKIKKIFKEFENDINNNYIKIRSDACGVDFTSNFINCLRDDFYMNEGKRAALNIIRNKIYTLIEEKEGKNNEKK